MSTHDGPDSMNRERLLKLQQLSDLMDRAFVIPGTEVRFGFDPIIGLIPLAGDVFDVAFKANRKNVDIITRQVGGQNNADIVNVDQGLHPDR